MTAEQQARRNIDKMLEAAGWHVQSHTEHNTGAAFGVAVREYPLRADQRADYLLSQANHPLVNATNPLGRIGTS